MARAAFLRTFGLAAGLAAALLAIAPGAAQPAEEVGGSVTSFSLGDWAGLGLRLALVVGVIWAGVAAMRWYVRRVNGARGRGGLGALEVIETHALGPNRALHLVRVGGRAVLVGATPERITQLLTVDDPDELERLAARPEETPVRVAGGVSSVLASLGTGIAAVRAMNGRRRALDARAKEQRAATSVPRTPEGNRFAALRSVLGAPARTPRRKTVAPAAETRQSLFDRTLASIDAIQIANGVNAADGLRARAGYGQVDTGRSFEAQREAQIADLQRAIRAARRNAG